MAKKKKGGKKEKIDIRDLNNKSRKGRYVYIKIGNNRGSYYKYDENIPIDAYVNYYKDKYIKKVKTTSVRRYTKAYAGKLEGVRFKKRTRPIRQAEQYIQKLKRTRPQLHEALKTGITTTKIKDIRTATDNMIQHAKKQLMRPIVLDTQLLDIITTRENMKKLQERIEYRLQFIDKKGNILASDSKIGPDPDKITHQLKEIIKPMEEITKDTYSNLKKKLEELGFENWRLYKAGKVWRTEMTMIFRKIRRI